MQPFVAKFLKDNLSAVEAIRTVLPVWKHLVLHPRLFFAELADTPRLSLKNAVSFALSSATLLTATVLAISAVLNVYFYFFKPGSSSRALPAPVLALVEVGFFAFFFLGATGTASVVYLSALCTLQRCSFKRLFVASLYFGAFLNTVSIAMMFVLAGLIVPFGTYRQLISLLGSRHSPFDFLEMGLHPAVAAWVGAMQVWTNVVGPVLSMVMQTRVTRLGVFRLLSGLIILLVVLVAVIFGARHVHPLFRASFPGPAQVRGWFSIHHSNRMVACAPRLRPNIPVTSRRLGWSVRALG